MGLKDRESLMKRISGKSIIEGIRVDELRSECIMSKIKEIIQRNVIKTLIRYNTVLHW